MWDFKTKIKEFGGSVPNLHNFLPSKHPFQSVKSNTDALEGTTCLLIEMDHFIQGLF